MPSQYLKKDYSLSLPASGISGAPMPFNAAKAEVDGGTGDFKFNPDGTVRVKPPFVVLSFPINAADIDTSVFVANDGYQLVACTSVVATGAATATCSVTKCTTTQAPSAGTVMLVAPVDLNTTANTVITNALSLTAANLKLVSGQRIGFDFTNSLAGVAATITLYLKRI